jgi:sec-independent protein translocase protein TatA
MSLGAPELLILLVIVLVLFGSSRLPKLARSLGQASKEFKKGVDKDDDEQDEPEKATPAGDEQITMSKAELDALLAEREAKARGSQGSPPPTPDAPPPA